jgi:hypothetical protein
LRWAARPENGQNVKIRKDNTSNYKGVCFSKAAHKYQANITVNGKLKHLGLFTTAEQASEAYEAAAKVIHKEFYHKILPY